MKLLANIFAFIGVFLIPVGIVYGFMTHFDEWAGFPAILATAVMCLFLWYFLKFTDKKHPDMPYENLEGEIADGAGDYGFYSPWSWWPLFIGAACTIVVLGLAIDWWIVLIAIPFAAAAVLGWVYEYNRGDHAH
ncbi:MULTISPECIES: cytochrome c oxidase subunit 4 [Rothia]|uniref:Cytochrome c oxidase polypeptide 4 n=1 Tax=Rothia nasimurium TaxID=85336 RepID=A0A1Y1RQI5_9MICC|nr:MULTISPECIES: cytochrome c oxidase subunit 4 [Rothia]ORC21993.1 cytochrome C oxidase subunit IV [Rothia nasimurium]